MLALLSFVAGNGGRLVRKVATPSPVRMSVRGTGCGGRVARSIFIGTPQASVSFFRVANKQCHLLVRVLEPLHGTAFLVVYGAVHARTLTWLLTHNPALSFLRALSTIPILEKCVRT